MSEIKVVSRVLWLQLAASRPSANRAYAPSLQMTKSAILVRMKRRMPSHSPITAPPATTLLIACASTILSLLLTAGIGCTTAPKPASTSQSSETTTQVRGMRSSLAGVYALCPSRGSSLVQAPPHANSGRKVILSWRASAPPDSKHGAATGYCIYRGKGDRDPSPQLVNPIPFLGTRCADDWVEDSAKYTYVVRAISAQGVTSGPSNVAPVVIKPAKPRDSDLSETAPLCRHPNPAK
jgi:hypothetical protein